MDYRINVIITCLRELYDIVVVCLQDTLHSVIPQYKITEARYFIRKCLRFPVRVVEFFDVVFNDEDWDYAYIDYMLRFKMERVLKHFRDNSVYVGVEEDIKKISAIVEHLKRADKIENYTEQFKDVRAESEDLEVFLTKKPDARQMFLHLRSENLALWHRSEAYRKLAKYGKRFWI